MVGGTTRVGNLQSHEQEFTRRVNRVSRLLLDRLKPGKCSSQRGLSIRNERDKLWRNTRLGLYLFQHVLVLRAESTKGSKWERYCNRLQLGCNGYELVHLG